MHGAWLLKDWYDYIYGKMGWVVNYVRYNFSYYEKRSECCKSCFVK